VADPPAVPASTARIRVPGLVTLRTYQPAWLRSDVVAGLVLGPDSSLGPMIAATILPLIAADGDPARAIALASMLALLVGVCMIAAGVCQLGFVADLFSKPTQIGYMNGLALTILVGQLPKLLGFSIDADTFLEDVTGFVRGVLDGKTVGAALALGVGGLVIILVLQRVAPTVPGVLVAVVAGIAAVVVFDLGSDGVSLVGVLPQGFPPLTRPDVGLGDIPLLVAGAVGITLVALTDTISTSSAFAERTGQEVDANQEMIGIGVANVAASLFQGFAVSTSGSRTAVAANSGAKSQLTGVVGALTIALMLLFAPGLFRNLPQPILASVVIAASISLADIPATVRLRRQRHTEFTISMAAFLGVALLGVLPGIAIAVLLSILNVFRKMWRPYRVELGLVEGLEGYHDRRFHPEATTIDGLVVFRFDAPLLFANARTFRDEIRALAAYEPRPRWIVVAAEPITDVDTTAADMLEDLDVELNARGISLVFAEMKTPVQDKVRRYELTRTIDPEHFFDTIGAAVRAFRAMVEQEQRR
jgi:high affinity sulfate transporter 1